MGNVTPRAIVKATQLFQEGKVDEAKKLAGEISRAEWVMLKGGINGVKVSSYSLPLRQCKLDLKELLSFALSTPSPITTVSLNLRHLVGNLFLLPRPQSKDGSRMR